MIGYFRFSTNEFRQKLSLYAPYGHDVRDLHEIIIRRARNQIETTGFSNSSRKQHFYEIICMNTESLTVVKRRQLSLTGIPNCLRAESQKKIQYLPAPINQAIALCCEYRSSERSAWRKFSRMEWQKFQHEKTAFVRHVGNYNGYLVFVCTLLS